MQIDLSFFLSKFCDSEMGVPSDYASDREAILALTSRTEGILNHGDYLEIHLGPIGTINFPFFRYKTLTSLDLLSPEDLFLFSRYLRNYPKFTEFIDVGANIGLHSIVARRIGYSVISFEPDPETFSISKEMFLRNGVAFTAFESSNASIENLSNQSDGLVLVEAAVSDYDGNTNFTKIIDNPTANHLSGRKSNIYGNTVEQSVPVIKISRFKPNTILKMDAEGEDYVILKSILSSGSFGGLIYLCDWRDETREKIFDCLCEYGLNCNNPFIEKSFEMIRDLPPSKSSDFLEVEVKQEK